MSTDTRQLLITSAEHMLRSKGYSAFSYADLEKMVGIKKASIHHHFPKKEDLGVLIIESHIAATIVNLDEINQRIPKAIDKLDEFVAIFKLATADGSLPLCGSLAAEVVLLPEKMQFLTRKYLALQLEWLKDTIEQGITEGDFITESSATQLAYQLLSLMEGSSFIRCALQNSIEIDSAVIGHIVGAKL